MSTSRLMLSFGVLGALSAGGVPVRALEPLTAEEEVRYADLDARSFQTFTNVDVGDYLALHQRFLASCGHVPDPAQEIGRYALKSLGQPYRLNAARFDYRESGCVVYCERAIALALSKDWESYRLVSERVRHKDGIVEYRSRNFLTLGDWLPNNKWLLEDITGQLGPLHAPVAETFTHVVGAKLFAELPEAPGSSSPRTAFRGSDYSSGNKEVRTDSFIPWKAIPAVLPQLRTGDVALTLYDAGGGHLGCEHWGIIVRDEDGVVSLLHSVPPRVRRDQLTAFATRSARLSGFKFLRLRSDARQRVAEEAAKVATSFAVPNAVSEDARVAEVARSRAMQPPEPPQPALKHPYQVRRHDTWWSLADEWLGDGNRWQELSDLNKVKGTAPGGRLRAGVTIELEP